MNFKVKSFISVITSALLIAGGFNAPANATAPEVNLVLANNSLEGSSVTGFDPMIILRLAVIAELGEVTWNNAGSGATLLSGSGRTSQALLLSGTQAQLSAAIKEITVNTPCGGTYNIHAQVSDSGFIKNPLTGHLYKYNDQEKNLDLALAEAAATPLVTGGNNTFGYLATVTDSTENQIVNMLGEGWIGASDRDTEGDWKWLAGPEAGMSFYDGNSDNGGAALPGKFAGWGEGEPNDSDDEDYSEIYGDGSWNDSQDGDRRFVIEWGGMPGDDLSSVSVTSDSVEVVVQGPFAGSGTQADPFDITNATELRAVASCGSPDAYFRQSREITLPSDWAGDQTFQGHYDGDGESINYSEGTVVTHDGFGIWATSSGSNSSVSNLFVTGDLVSTSHGTVGLLFGSGSATLNSITVSGSISTTDGRWETGGVAGAYSGNLSHVESSVNIYSTSDGGSFGGVVGYFWGNMDYVTWDGEMNIGGSGESYRIGGLAGDTDCTNISHSESTGTITISNTGHQIGGLVGYLCGELSSSRADVEITTTISESIGGAVGYAGGYVFNTAAYGDVSGADKVGGLFGSASGNEADDVYARGNVVAGLAGGSLVGYLDNFTIYRAYATGTVSADISRGLYGEYIDSSTSNTHWIPSQSTVDEPSPLQVGEVPFTHLQSKDLAFYNNEGWSMDTDWAEGVNWTICEAANDGYPFITSFYRNEPCLANQTLTPTPTISGTGVEGEELTANIGTWDAGVQLDIAWFAGNIRISDVATTTFTPGVSLVGRSVTVRVLGRKNGFNTVLRFSLGKAITARVIVPQPTNLNITIGGFRGNSWWAPSGFVKTIKAGVKSHRTATTITCVGIVGSGGSKSWQKTLGLHRAALACATAKLFKSNLKTKLTWKVSKKADRIQRGVTLKFNR